MYACSCAKDVRIFNLYLCFFKQMTASSNLLLWLDATDETTMMKTGNEVREWRSKDATGRALKPAFTNPPLFHEQDDYSPASIEFDFNKTMMFNHSLTDIKTVISVHKYKETESQYWKNVIPQ